MILFFTTGIGILPYIILAIAMEDAPENEKIDGYKKEALEDKEVNVIDQYPS